MRKKLSARESAVHLLSRRDHGEYELQQKLKAKEFEQDEIDLALAYCQINGWLDDLRYAKSQVRQQVYRGRGERRIRQALNLQRIDDDVIEQAFEAEPQDWFEHAKETADKKFKGLKAEDNKQYAKQIRFLQYRGFSFDQIKYAIDQLGEKNED